MIPYFVQPPDPPQNLVASNDLPMADTIEVSWDAPADDSEVKTYHVYRQGPGESEFTLHATMLNKFVTSYQDTGLTPGEYYEYYATSEGLTGGESEPSNTDGTTPSEYVEINITDLTTDKTTHCNDASEPASNLEVTVDVVPDSIDWEASAGVLTPNGSTATWLPTAGMDPVKVTVTCTAHLGPGEDSATLDLYVTEASIKTTGLQGQSIGDPPGSGHFIEFDNLPLLTPLAEGGEKVDGRPMSYYMTQDHVVIHAYFRTT